MRYAIISDIHGNITALDAILDDCDKQNIDIYLFLGDYYGELSKMDDVISRLNKIENSYIIKGNREKRLIEIKNENPIHLSGEQYAPVHWIMNDMRDDDFLYFKSLPDVVSFQVENINFYLAHAPDQHFGHGINDQISGRTFLDEFGKYYSNHDEYLAFVRTKLRNDQKFMLKLSELPEGVYLFCHYHTQWNDNIDGRILINPGSCGWPLDFNTSAPYTILDTCSGIQIEERRIDYDLSIVLRTLEKSGIKEAMPFWYKLILSELKFARNELLLFIEFIADYAKKQNDETYPYTDQLWNEAATLYSDLYLTHI